MLVGKQTWRFSRKPSIVSTGTVAGPLEKEGFIKDDIDQLHDDLWIEEKSFEKAQQSLMEQSSQISLKKANIKESDVNFFINGDLTNQITPTTLAANELNIPYLGLFSACATVTEGLALSAFICNNGGAKYILTGSSSHYAAAERQFRNPTEYGGQEPPSSQVTVTGAGSALIAPNGSNIKITSATIGKVCDYGITDPFNMGAAMAPAAVDTIITHLKELKICASSYDLIVTGDLGEIGHKIAYDMLKEEKIKVNEKNFKDCGLLIYKDDQPVLSGGSGAACAAIVTFGHLFKQMQKGKLNKILVVATGSLHSPLTVNQKENIPCIAHAVSLENGCDH